MKKQGFSGLAGSTLLAFAIFGAVGCDKIPIVSKKPTTAQVTRQDLVGYGFFEGTVSTPPGATATVVSPYDITIDEVLVTQGSRVGRGATMIKMSLPNLESSLQQAELNYKAAESAYAGARLQLNGPVIEAERALKEARDVERKARADLQSGLSADLESATAARKSAEDGLRIAVANRDAQLASEKQALEISAEYLKDVRAGAKVANIRAPISGNVVSLEAKPGLVVEAKQNLATLVDLGAITIQGVVPAELADHVQKGTAILIVLDGSNAEPIEGKVKEVTIMPPSDGQKSAGYLAVIDFNNEKGWVLPGSKIKRLGVRTGSVDDALVVPVGAVQKGSDGRAYVEVQSGSEWVRKSVETGLSDGVLMEVKSGLNESDVVKVKS